MSSKPQKRVNYRTECKSGCGTLNLDISADEVNEIHKSKDIRCKECKKINVAEVQDP